LWVDQSGAEAREAASAADIVSFPLTMPITAGAGSLAVTISLWSRVSHSGTGALVGYGGVIIGIALVFVNVASCYRFADAIFRRIARLALPYRGHTPHGVHLAGHRGRDGVGRPQAVDSLPFCEMAAAAYVNSLLVLGRFAAPKRQPVQTRHSPAQR